jgi:glycosyltransferase involved in cell wall biosynthesis
LKLSKRIEGADFFLNYSGRFTGGINLGWDSIRVINAGYYPPPLPGSKFVDRTGSTSRGRKKKLFLSGVESWHRGGDILWRTLKKLREYWPKFEVFSTGNGPATVKLLSGEDCLPITFTGYLDLPTLITQYETCDAFLALGHEEPWGIRVNDALNCGAPVIISNGMGSSTVVSQYKCGWVFRAGSEDALADAIIHFISDEVGYRQRAANVRAASKAIAPANAAMLAGKEIADRFLNWRPSS